jgi:hypothetical protein
MSDWIPHTPGDPMPCDGGMEVFVNLRGENELLEKFEKAPANQYVWAALNGADWEIVAWKPANPESEMKNDTEKLVEAAPDLLEALEEIISDLEHEEPDGWMSGVVHSDGYKKAVAAIAKAKRGEA